MMGIEVSLHSSWTMLRLDELSSIHPFWQKTPSLVYKVQSADWTIRVNGSKFTHWLFKTSEEGRTNMATLYRHLSGAVFEWPISTAIAQQNLLISLMLGELKQVHLDRPIVEAFVGGINHLFDSRTWIWFFLNTLLSPVRPIPHDCWRGRAVTKVHDVKESLRFLVLVPWKFPLLGRELLNCTVSYFLFSPDPFGDFLFHCPLVGKHLKETLERPGLRASPLLSSVLVGIDAAYTEPTVRPGPIPQGL